MAENEAAPKTRDAVVICLYPDVCKSPDKPVPYQIVAYYSDQSRVSPNTNITGVPAATKDSRITTVKNDEPGGGGGVKSGVNTGYCRPTSGWSSTVNVNGQPILRHTTQFDMNCAGPEGPGNTKGKTVYQTGAPVAKVKPSGAVSGDTNPQATATPAEKGWFERTWDSSKELASDAWEGAKQLDQEYKVTARALGVVQTVGGAGEMVLGGVGLLAPTGVTQVLGAVGVVHGADTASAGLSQIWTGEFTPTLTEQAAAGAATLAGASPEAAGWVGTAADMAAGITNPTNLLRQGAKEAAEKAAKEAAEKAAKEAAEKAAKEAAEKAEKEAAEKAAKDAGDGVQIKPRYGRGDAKKLIDDSEGRKFGNNEGHNRDHIPKEGEDPAKLAESRPNKQNTTTYRSGSQAERDLRDIMNANEQQLANLKPGEVAKGVADLPGRQGFNSVLGQTATPTVFNQATWSIGRLPSGDLHLLHFSPKL